MARWLIGARSGDGISFFLSSCRIANPAPVLILQDCTSIPIRKASHVFAVYSYIKGYNNEIYVNISLIICSVSVNTYLRKFLQQWHEKQGMEFKLKEITCALLIARVVDSFTSSQVISLL